MQEKLRRKEFALFKVKGDDNPADLFTKHLNREKMHRALQFMSCEFREGRSPAAPQRKDYEKILGEDIEWQVEDAVREEFDDYEVESGWRRNANVKCMDQRVSCRAWRRYLLQPR